MAIVGTVLIFVLIFGLGLVVGGAIVNAHYRDELAYTKQELKQLKETPPAPLYYPTSPKPWSKDDYT